MSVVTVEQLKAYMSGINMSITQTDAAQVILDGVQGELEKYINRSIGTRLVREVASTDSSGFAYLSQTPVYAINKITPASDELSTYQDGGEVVVLDPLVPGPNTTAYDLVPANFGRDLIVPGGVMSGYLDTSVAVEYIAGGGDFLAPYMDSIMLAILRVAAREFQTNHDDTMSLRDTSATTPTDPVPVPRKGWRDDELRQFDRIRRRVVI
jgi:hypothetical protein